MRRNPSDFVRLIAEAWKTDVRTFGPAFEMGLLFANHAPEAARRLSNALEAESACPEADAHSIDRFLKALEVWENALAAR